VSNMLSRVLSGRNHLNVEAAVFPRIERESQSGSQDRAPDSTDDTAHLRERLEHTEHRIAGAKKQAFEEGRAQGEQQARAEVGPVLEKLSAAIVQLAELKPDLRRRAEHDVVRLALLIAKRVLHREVTVDDEALTAIAHVAFARLSRAESYRVKVNPRFVNAIRAALPVNQGSRVEIEADPSCAPGTLIINTPEGSVDASIDTQLEEIGRGLTDRLLKSAKST